MTVSLEVSCEGFLWEYGVQWLIPIDIPIIKQLHEDQEI